MGLTVSRLTQKWLPSRSANRFADRATNLFFQVSLGLGQKIFPVVLDAKAGRPAQLTDQLATQLTIDHTDERARLVVVIEADADLHLAADNEINELVHRLVAAIGDVRQKRQ